jgi:hypothetical protein
VSWREDGRVHWVTPSIHRVHRHDHCWQDLVDVTLQGLSGSIAFTTFQLTSALWTGGKRDVSRLAAALETAAGSSAVSNLRAHFDINANLQKTSVQR